MVYVCVCIYTHICSIYDSIYLVKFWKDTCITSEIKNIPRAGPLNPCVCLTKLVYCLVYSDSFCQPFQRIWIIDSEPSLISRNFQHVKFLCPQPLFQLVNDLKKTLSYTTLQLKGLLFEGILGFTHLRIRAMFWVCLGSQQFRITLTTAFRPRLTLCSSGLLHTGLPHMSFCFASPLKSVTRSAN